MLRLTKHHGLGNDFLVALLADNPGLVPDPVVARALCDRHRGVGADGLLYGLPGVDGADVQMVLLNADGSEAEISGNGIRCLGQAWLRAAGRTEGDVLVDAGSGRRELRVVRADGDEMWIRVDMGEVRPGPGLPVDPSSLPGDRWATVDVGNPHLVVLVDDPAAVDLATVGPRLEQAFAGGINVHVVATDGGTVDLRVWERGAGITQACGSGATAAASVVHGWGLAGSTVDVVMPGGAATVELVDGRAFLTGPTVFVAEVAVP
ncbi:MAG: diaminopimelate epimerase [Actinomycetes bacterium]